MTTKLTTTPSQQAANKLHNNSANLGGKNKTSNGIGIHTGNQQANQNNLQEDSNSLPQLNTVRSWNFSIESEFESVVVFMVVSSFYFFKCFSFLFVLFIDDSEWKFK